MADKKFSQFTNGNEMQIGDEVVGLRPSAPTENFRFDFPGAGIKDSDGNYLFEYATVGALAVNHLKFVNSVTGNPALLTADGTDSNIDISLQPKGTGKLILDELNWPTADGAANTFLATDGSGNLFFFPGGVATSIVGTANQVLANGTSGVAQTGSVTLSTPQDIATTSSPTFAGLTLTTPLTLANGGSSKALTASAGGIVWTDSNSMEILAGTSTANQLLLSGNAATPSWSTSTYPATNAINTLLYASAANTMAALATVNRASLSTNATGVPTWLAMTDGQLIIGSTAGAPAAGSLTAGSGISITPGSNSISIAATSGSGSPLTTKGDLYTYSTVNDRLPVGATNGMFLQVNSAAATGLAWSTATLPVTTTINQILYSSSNNVVAGLATANSAILYTNSSGVPAWSASMTNGQVMIGSTGASPAPATLTAGSGISIAVGANSITISGTGSGIGWNEVTGTSQAMSADTGYIANNAGLVTFTLPVTAALGTVINVVGKGAGGWLIAQNGGQNIQIGAVSSTVGVGGSVASTNRFDSLELLCTTANTTWTILGGGQSAGFTIV